MASAAVPGLAPTGVAGSPDDAADFDSAVLVDELGKHWRVRSPKHLEASMRLETELLVLRAFVPAVRAELPFALPYVAGTVRQDDLCTFVYSHLPGTPMDIDALAAAGGALHAEVGRTMAVIHSLPQALVHEADLPSYSANEFRQRKLNELDQAATTGKIPAVLLRRWEHALEDVSLWRFRPCVVHGDLHEDNLLVSGRHISAVSGWTDLRVGDPADDFAWLIAANDPAFTDAVLAAYHAARPDAADPHLIRRAALSAEFALAQWLVRGVAAENPEIIAEAEEMLHALEEDIVVQEAEAAREAAEQEAAREAAAQRAALDGNLSGATRVQPGSSPAAPAAPPLDGRPADGGTADASAAADAVEVRLPAAAPAPPKRGPSFPSASPVSGPAGPDAAPAEPVLLPVRSPEPPAAHPSVPAGQSVPSGGSVSGTPGPKQADTGPEAETTAIPVIPAPADRKR